MYHSAHILITSLLAVSLGVFSACGQSVPGPVSASSSSVSASVHQSTKYPVTVQAQVRPQTDGHAQISIRLQLPSHPTSFTTQAIDTSKLVRVQGELYGLGISQVIHPDQANENGDVNIPGSGEIELTFSQVPYGKGRVLSLIFSEASGSTEGGLIATVFDLSTTTNEVEISFRTVPVAWVVRGLLTRAPELFSTVSITQLQSLVDAIIQRTGSAPNYEYAISPWRIDPQAIITDLIANGGKTDVLNASDSRYVLDSMSVAATVNGLVADDRLNLRVTDASSSAIRVGNGIHTIDDVQIHFDNLERLQGLWSLVATLPGAGTLYEVAISEPTLIHSGQGLLERSVTVTPVRPVLSGLSASVGQTGDTLILNGQYFHTNPDGNIVKFGDVVVPNLDISVLSNTEMQVKVPAGITGPVTVTVSVGTQTSNPQTFTPYIASDAKEIQSFGFLAAHNPGLTSDVVGTITGRQVWVTLPEGTSVHNLTANFGVSTNASLSLNDIPQQANSTRNNFAYPLSYTVTAENGSTQTYQIVVQSSLSALDTQAQSFMNTYNVPGMTLTVARNGQIVYAKGYGEANTTTHEKVTNRHLFRIGSITKPLTAAIILKLAEEGAFHLDDKVFGPGRILGTQYGTYPYGAYVADISVRNLLEHMVGGWPNDGNDPVFQQLNLNQNDLMNHILNNCPGSPCSLTEVPGTRAVYSNAGYFILGRIIEKVAGQSYEVVIKNQLAQPLGISDIHVGSDSLAGKRSNEVVYYPQEPYPAYNNFNLPRLDSVGGLIAAGPDLVRLLYDVEINHGWSPYSHYGWWNHTGAIPGTGTLFVRDSTIPGSVYTWSVLTNTRSIPQEAFFEAMRTTFQSTINGISQWPQYE